LLSLLPDETPPFQQELSTVWTGPPKQRTIAGVLKIYTKPEDATKVTKIFESTFKRSNSPTFIRKDYFNSLEHNEKLKFIDSQTNYQQQHRTLLIRGIRTLEIPTKIQDYRQLNISLKEYILQVPDYQRNHLFVQANEVNDTDIEVQFNHNNLTIAQKWIKHAATHIARVISPTLYNKVFTGSIDEDEIYVTDQWDPPSPPRVQLTPRHNVWQSPIPSSIASSTKFRPGGKASKSKNDNDSDCYTATTIATQMSCSQEVISELQSESLQHHTAIEEQSRRFTKLDAQVQSSLTRFSTQMESIEAEQRLQQIHHTRFSTQISSLAKTQTTIMNNIDEQQTRMISYFQEQNNINVTYTEEIKTLQRTIAIQQTELTNIRQIIDRLQARQPTTPNSMNHQKKKPRSNEESDQRQHTMATRETNEIHQLESLYTQDISMVAYNHEHLQLSQIHTDDSYNQGEEDTSSTTSAPGDHSENDSFHQSTQEPGNQPGKDT
jgi:hypothetical protein